MVIYLSLTDELIKLATAINNSLTNGIYIFHKFVLKTFFSECTFLLLGAEGRAWHVTFAGINVNNCLLLLLACWRLCVCVVGVAGLLLPPGICCCCCSCCGKCDCGFGCQQWLMPTM